MNLSRQLRSIWARQWVWPVGLAVVLCMIALTLSLQLAPWRNRPLDAEPPWIYGDPHARFTIVEYADLECPYCRAYYPVLHDWIDAHHDVNWQWHHFPLAMHEPAARQEATWVECAGRVNGQHAFWVATAWVYAHTRGNGDGLPSGVPFPHRDHAMTRCLQAKETNESIQADLDDGQREQVPGTPTLKIMDHTTGRTVVISGPVGGDALLSAIDKLDSEGTPAASTSPVQKTTTPSFSRPE